MATFPGIGKGDCVQKNVPVPEPLSSWVALSWVQSGQAGSGQEGIFTSLALNPALIQLQKSDLSAG